MRRLGVSLALLVMAASLAAPAVARPGDDPDPTYRFDSRITTDFGGGDDRIGALVTQPDGNIVAGGTATFDGSGPFALARYRPDGTLDPAFGSGGLVTTRIGGGGEIHGLALQPDGKIVAAGVAVPAGHPNGGVPAQFALARYLPGGRPDPAFGDHGTVTTQVVPGVSGIGRAVALQADGRVVVGGKTNTGSGFDSVFALVRYLPDGRVDTSFGGDGIVTTDVSAGDDGIEALLVAPDGKLIAAGLVAALVLQTNGKIVAAGTADTTGQLQFAAARYLPDGRLDPTFGVAGTALTDFSPLTDQALDVTIANGRIIAGGQSNFTGRAGSDFALVGLPPPLPIPAIDTPTPDPVPLNLSAAAARTGYWALAGDGHVYPFGDAPALGHTTGGAVDLEPTPSGKGYWAL